MTAARCVRRRLVLLDGSGPRAVLLADDTALGLLRWVLASSGDEAAVDTPAILAQADPSWSAWLAEQKSVCASESSWRQVDQLLPVLANSLVLASVTDADRADWAVAQSRSSSVPWGRYSAADGSWRLDRTKRAGGAKRSSRGRLAAKPFESVKVWPISEVTLAAMRMAARERRLEHDFAAALEREKLAAMKELAYGASHEINNPLANISSRAQLLLRDESDPQRRQSLATINSQAFRAHEMIADMMLFAKPPELQCAVVDLIQLLTTTFASWAGALPAEVQFSIRLEAGEVKVRVDEVLLTEALRAIWTNALEAMGSAGRLNVRAGRRADERTLSKLEMCEIEIADSGPGIRPEVRRHLFDPFFSGREAGRGLGFGLAKAWRIVTLHGGRIDVASDPAEGARFTVRLPCSGPDVSDDGRGEGQQPSNQELT